MGRTSKLTDEQWKTLGARLLAGEKAAALSREYGVSNASISERFSERNRKVRIAAEKIVDAERTVIALPIPEQKAARSLATSLISISENVSSAAEYGSATSRHLARVAMKAALKITDVPTDDESLTELKGVAYMQRVANDAGALANTLLAITKDALKDATQEQRPQAQRVTVDVVDASLPDA